jgi:hypothetical protein
MARHFAAKQRSVAFGGKRTSTGSKDRLVWSRMTLDPKLTSQKSRRRGEVAGGLDFRRPRLEPETAPREEGS